MIAAFCMLVIVYFNFHNCSELVGMPFFAMMMFFHDKLHFLMQLD